MIEDKFVLVDANDPDVGWLMLGDLDAPAMYVGEYNPLTGLEQPEFLSKCCPGYLDFLLSLTFCVVSDREYLKDKVEVPFYLVATREELVDAIEEVEKLWLLT